MMPTLSSPVVVAMTTTGDDKVGIIMTIAISLVQSVLKTNGPSVAPGDQKLGWTSQIWHRARKNHNI